MKITATEFWEKKFGEKPQTDVEKLAVAMMAEYGDYLSHPLEPLVMPNEVVAGGNNELLKFLRWLYDQEELELTETGWYYKEDEEGTYELSNLEVLNKYYASQRKA